MVERTHKVTQKYLPQANSLVIVKSNAERIRARLIKNKSLQFTALQPYNVSALNKTNSHIYQVNDKIYVAAETEHLQTGMTGRVKGVDHHNNTITAELNGEKIDVELSKSGNVLRLYKGEEREFAKGDKVDFLQNDSVLGVQNGLTGTIEKISSKGDLRVALGPAQKVELNITDYPYLNYGYAVTEYKAQGQRVSNVIYISDTRNINNYQNFYVAIYIGLSTQIDE